MAKQYGIQVLEMDMMIEEREGMSISDIFAKHSEEYFRDAETKLLQEICLHENKVVSCGGGVVLREQNVEVMKKSGKIIMLSAKAETILKRLKDDNNRPLLKENKNVAFVRDMLEKRRPKYEGAADIIIQTDDKRVADICNTIYEQIKREGET